VARNLNLVPFMQSARGEAVAFWRSFKPWFDDPSSYAGENSEAERERRREAWCEQREEARREAWFHHLEEERRDAWRRCYERDPDATDESLRGGLEGAD
jgi:hypothetical protein